LLERAKSGFGSTNGKESVAASEISKKFKSPKNRTVNNSLRTLKKNKLSRSEAKLKGAARADRKLPGLGLHPDYGLKSSLPTLRNNLVKSGSRKNLRGAGETGDGSLSKFELMALRKKRLENIRFIKPPSASSRESDDERSPMIKDEPAQKFVYKSPSTDKGSAFYKMQQNKARF